jgi:hypothetical protein
MKLTKRETKKHLKKRARPKVFHPRVCVDILSPSHFKSKEDFALRTIVYCRTT